MPTKKSDTTNKSVAAKERVQSYVRGARGRFARKVSVEAAGEISQPESNLQKPGLPEPKLNRKPLRPDLLPVPVEEEAPAVSITEQAALQSLGISQGENRRFREALNTVSQHAHTIEELRKETRALLAERSRLQAERSVLQGQMAKLQASVGEANAQVKKVTLSWERSRSDANAFQALLGAIGTVVDGTNGLAEDLAVRVEHLRNQADKVAELEEQKAEFECDRNTFSAVLYSIRDNCDLKDVHIEDYSQTLSERLDEREDLIKCLRNIIKVRNLAGIIPERLGDEIEAIYVERDSLSSQLADTAKQLSIAIEGQRQLGSEVDELTEQLTDQHSPWVRLVLAVVAGAVFFALYYIVSHLGGVQR